MIYRLPGEKLGLGLRFDGGSKANELVNRLFVQCCAKGSPSAKTKCTWGFLSDGDEIISISSKLVRRMTRVDCVKALKGKMMKPFLCILLCGLVYPCIAFYKALVALMNSKGLGYVWILIRQ